MKAIGETSTEHRALLNEYRVALRLWSEVRALYSESTSPEVAGATKHLEEIERDLKSYSGPILPVLDARSTPA